MKKLSLLFCISLFSIAASYGQLTLNPSNPIHKTEKYCEIRYKFSEPIVDQSGKYRLVDGTEGVVIFDKNVNAKLFQDSIVVNKLDNVTICKSSIDVINYMASIGWYLISAVPLTHVYSSEKQPQGTWEIIFFFRKEFLVNAGRTIDLSSNF